MPNIFNCFRPIETKIFQYHRTTSGDYTYHTDYHNINLPKNIRLINPPKNQPFSNSNSTNLTFSVDGLCYHTKAIKKKTKLV